MALPITLPIEITIQRTQAIFVPFVLIEGTEEYSVPIQRKRSAPLLGTFIWNAPIQSTTEKVLQSTTINIEYYNIQNKVIQQCQGGKEIEL